MQVRTILMHSWAEMMHKLDYKKKIHLPPEMRRQFYILSAKLEDSDNHFERIFNLSNEYKKSLSKINKNRLDKFDEQPLNFDSLQKFMDITFPRKGKDSGFTRMLVDSMAELSISLKELKEYYLILKPHLKEIEKTLLENTKFKVWKQGGAIRTILDLSNDNYRRRHRKNSNRYRQLTNLSKKYIT